mmetsp:Transcript_24603/g.70924  ORF Transcript_24603/g.70924 Transcript_24603/m.70924 type:complete len:105 (+) Transcript_24603:2634-2948(+)
MESSNRFVLKKSSRASEKTRQVHETSHQHTGTVYAQFTFTPIAIVKVDGRYWPAPTSKESHSDPIATTKEASFFDSSSFYGRHKKTPNVEPHPHAARRYEICKR